jgi:hypothetical protein
MRIHEGIVWSNRDRRTLLDKMLALLGIVDLAEACYFVGDAYYASGKIINGLLAQNNHLLTRARSNAVAYRPFVASGPKRRGRPRIYDKKVALRALFRDTPALQEMPILLDNSECSTFAKFILDRQDQDKIELFRMAA